MVRIADLENNNYWKHLGMMTEETEDGKIQLVMKVTENLKQFYGNVHGGAIASLFDACIAVAINQRLSPEEGASTVELKLNYLRPVQRGTLYALGNVIHKGRRIVVGQGEIKDDQGKTVAYGTATFMITQL
ncbi:hypothetical protein Desaci_1811 [Desulfosporosinus acidiphilus SJ4]|uniref:Thioesterase domain-containing protein n=1 Tax=Desulfosporosinus acidiphilus (strain DSM 22704 / JCM 16185 / SJ4) TaxID=646529 RepID=I4D4S4_DESAJ|nr:PaaI family thioesterase [Desulfosporosinus acidiphilus]AFM40798.1 hypothetical protein Desaci_1811 [Desulfosporosinus acidiphilus SJ4]